MKKIKVEYFLLAIGSFFISSCIKNHQAASVDYAKGPIVTVYENTLYQTDLKDLIDYSTSKEDSIAIVERYIAAWVNDQLFYNHAKKNINDRVLIDKMVDEYRKSLIISEYQNRLLKEKIGATVSDNVLDAYFSKNKSNFLLEENIIKGLFLIVPRNSKELNNFRKWYTSKDPLVISNIEQNLLKNAVGYENFSDTWISFEKVLDNLPQPIVDQEKFLKTNKTYEVSDSTFVYFLSIKDFKLIGTEAPYSFVKDDVRSIYQESQRMNFIENMKATIRKEAEDKGELIYHNLKK